MQAMNKSCVVVGLNCLYDFPHGAQHTAEANRGQQSREVIIGSDSNGHFLYFCGGLLSFFPV